MILVGMPLPKQFSETRKQIEASQQQYFELAAQRKLVRRTYMSLLLLLTVLVLFATTWLALFLSKLVTRPVAALAEATQEISRGRLDYRVEVSAADEIGDLVRSFNRMAEELESSRRQIEASSRELSAANVTLEQRRRHIETILESIPTGVLSLDADRQVTHVNYALLRLFRPKGGETGGPGLLIGASLADIFPPEVLEDLEPLLRRADRMGTTTTQMEADLASDKLNVAVTVATLQHQDQRLGYVLVFEDLSDLLQAQKQAAWREVARRVAHEIKNPLTPIALSAERIQRHLDRGPLDAASLEVLHGCAETIAAAVETVRTLVDEFATLARFPTARPRPADINSIVENTLAMFDGRLDNIRVQTRLAPDLPSCAGRSGSDQAGAGQPGGQCGRGAPGFRAARDRHLHFSRHQPRRCRAQRGRHRPRRHPGTEGAALSALLFHQETGHGTGAGHCEPHRGRSSRLHSRGAEQAGRHPVCGRTATCRRSRRGGSCQTACITFSS